MLKYLKYILIVAVVASMSSCGSSRRAFNNDDIYYEQISDKSKKSKQKNKQKKQKPDVKNDVQDSQKALLDEAYAWIGVPYASGGHSKRGTDCSGFVMEVYKKVLGIDLPRNSASQSEACDRVKKAELQVGDLVFFHPAKKGKISHVGIYVGDNKMIHASSHGVMVNDLSEVYYERCYSHGGRIPAFAAILSRQKGKEK